MYFRMIFRSAPLLAALLLVACSQQEAPATEQQDSPQAKTSVAEPRQLVVYSSRKEHLIKPLFDRYSEETGTVIRYITDNAGPLIVRLKSEGNRTPADLLLTVDVGNLWHAAQEGVLAAIDSPVLEANVPASLRDPEGRWFGETIRARTIVYSTERVKPAELSSYEALADAQWKGRLCLRTSKKVYNQSLVAALLASLGEQRTLQVVKGWVANLATAPFANDTMAMEAIVAGQCDVTLVNTYYFGRLQKKQPDLPLALFWPNQDDRGVHVNISGGGVVRYARHPAEAQAFLEWLSSDEAQHMLTSLNQEYPIRPGVKVDPIVKAWGEFKADPRPLSEIAALQTEAVKLIDVAGYH